MTWKHDIQLGDLDGEQKIELTCRRCGHSRYERVSDLLERETMTPQAYLDEVEARLACRRRGCRGGVRITLAEGGETSGFVGGLP